MRGAPTKFWAMATMVSATDLVIDTSAILAILQAEPEAAAFLQAICGACQPSLCAATRTELLIVAHARFGAIGVEKTRQFLDMQGIKTLALDQPLADLTADAYARYGKGRHPAGLNYGDCFSYALAKQAGAPLLFKGLDFGQTDVAVHK